MGHLTVYLQKLIVSIQSDARKPFSSIWGPRNYPKPFQGKVVEVTLIREYVTASVSDLGCGFGFSS